MKCFTFNINLGFVPKDPVEDVFNLGLSSFFLIKIKVWGISVVLVWSPELKKLKVKLYISMNDPTHDYQIPSQCKISLNVKVLMTTPYAIKRKTQNTPLLTLSWSPFPWVKAIQTKWKMWNVKFIAKQKTNLAWKRYLQNTNWLKKH